MQQLLLFLNPDIRLPPGSVAAMAARFADPRVGVLAPPLQRRDVRHRRVRRHRGHHRSSRRTDQSSTAGVRVGCALMTRASLFSELGGFDDRFFMFVEDVDYCWRALLSGFEVTVPVIEPAWHFGGAATPGGYISSQGSLSSTLFRVVLRERNTLTMLLKCYGAAARGGGDSPLRRAEPPDRRRLGCPRPPGDRARHARRLPVESARAAADARVAAARSGVPQGAGHADPPADVPRCVEAAPAEAVRRSPGVGG